MLDIRLNQMLDISSDEEQMEKTLMSIAQIKAINKFISEVVFEFNP